MSGTEKKMYKIVQFSRKQKDYYRWSRLYLAYVDSRKYKNVLKGDTTIPYQDDPEVKRETDDAVKAEYADNLENPEKLRQSYSQL